MRPILILAAVAALSSSVSPSMSQSVSNVAPWDQAFLPPALEWDGASRSLLADASNPWITDFERDPELNFSPDYAATRAWFDRLDAASDLIRIEQIGAPAILKTRRFGYDGKGQAVLRRPEDAEPAWDTIKGASAILERFVPFEREVSVVAARAIDGTVKAYAVTENEHREQILRRSVVPAAIHPATAREAISVASRLGAALDYVGVFAVEFFVGSDGGAEMLCVNEIAPRVHNSGHWTLDGADTSQFEQHVRAIAGLPLGSTALRGMGVEMVNLIGTEVFRWPDILAETGAQLHLYGKGEARPGRKMGHVTRILRD
jgi:5-(carboxyamino)imidazole ribonucleotide synthase